MFSYSLFGYHKWLLPNCHFYLVTKMVITNLSLQNCLFYLVTKLSLPKKSLPKYGRCQIAGTNNPSVNISANEVFTLLHLTIWSIWFSKKKEGKKKVALLTIGKQLEIKNYLIPRLQFESSAACASTVILSTTAPR